MDLRENRLTNIKDELDQAKKDRNSSLACAIGCGLIALFSAALYIDPTLADRISMDARMLKGFMPVFLIISVVNVFLYIRFRKTVRKLSEQLGETKTEEPGNQSSAEDPKEK